MNDLYTQLIAKTHKPFDVKDQCSPQWCYIIARNMLHSEWNNEWELGQSILAADTTCRIALAIGIGGYLEMRQHTQGGRWFVYLMHKDGTDEEIVSFRRRKRAVEWIGHVYLYALDKIR